MEKSLTITKDETDIDCDDVSMLFDLSLSRAINDIRSSTYKIFCRFLKQDLITFYRTVFLTILSDSDCTMSEKNLASFEHQESHTIEYKDFCQVLSDRTRFLWQ